MSKVWKVILIRDPRGFVLVDNQFGNSWSNPSKWWKETPEHQDETKYSGYKEAEIGEKPKSEPFLSYED